MLQKETKMIDEDKIETQEDFWNWVEEQSQKYDVSIDYFLEEFIL